MSQLRLVYSMKGTRGLEPSKKRSEEPRLWPLHSRVLPQLVWKIAELERRDPAMADVVADLVNDLLHYS